MGYDRSMNFLEKAILATIVYYDVLERPLTGWEVFKYLVNIGYRKNSPEARSKNDALATQGTSFYRTSLFPLSLNSVLNTLSNSIELRKYISQKNGFYFLKGRQKIIKQRIERQIIADRKWKKARRLIRFLQLIPYIRLVAVSGSLAMNNTKEESDIDLLIVSKAGRIWTCRAFTTLFIHLIGQRRHNSLTKDRFCLNHYITSHSLKIPWQSLYNAQTYAHLVSVWECDSQKGSRTPLLYNQFQKANQWISEYLINYPVAEKGYLTIVKSIKFFGLIRRFREWTLDTWYGNILESLFRKIQQRKIKKEPLTYKKGGRVVFNDEQLEFHPDSPEKRILEKYNQKMIELGFGELGQEKDSGLRL